MVRFGAIGMTYEQAGHGRAGLGIETSDDDVLTLKDRVAHHYTTGISTIEIASLNAEKLKKEFKAYFDKAKNNPIGKYKSYVIRGSNEVDKINSLRTLLDRHQIGYGLSNSTSNIKGFSYKSNKQTTVRLSANDIVVNTNQPKSNLIKALFEPDTKISDSLTYDITAWALPHSRGLDAYAMSTTIATKAAPEMTSIGSVTGAEKPYAYLSKWNSTDDVRFF